MNNDLPNSSGSEALLPSSQQNSLSTRQQLGRVLLAIAILAATATLLILLTLALVGPQGRQSCPGPVLEPTPRFQPVCRDFHVKLAANVYQADNLQGREPPSLTFLGDSIIESWMGTACGAKCGSRCHGLPSVFQAYFGNYSSMVLAVAGDQVANLQWRLMHGETFYKHPPKVAVLLIGTNDLGASACLGSEANITANAPSTAARIESVLDFMRTANKHTHIILMALLPRGSRTQPAQYDWPSRFTPAILNVNFRLQELAALDPDHVHFLDCSSVLLPDQQITRELLSDALHPNAKGMELVAKCLQPFVAHYMQE